LSGFCRDGPHSDSFDREAEHGWSGWLQMPVGAGNRPPDLPSNRRALEVDEDGKGGRSISMLVGAGRRVIPEGNGERQQKPLRWALGVVHKKAAKPSVKAFVFAKDSVRANGIRRERHRQGDDEWWVLAFLHEFVNALKYPVGERVDVLAV
jgi:hypothetical protein